MIKDIFEQQHRDILRIAGKIEDQLTDGTIRNPYTLRSLLSVLLGKLKVHLDMEQGSALTGSNHAHSDRLKEFHAFSHELSRYKKKWSAASTIGEEPKHFIEETHMIFSRFRGLVNP